MKYLYVIFPCLLALSSVIQTTLQAEVVLNDAVLNINGVVDSFAGYSSFGDPVPESADVSGFDGTTGLGTVTVTIVEAGNHYVGMYADLDIDVAGNTFSNENGSTNGSPASGRTWEIDEPGFRFPFGDIYGNISNSTLDSTNGVPSGSENDVAMALACDFNLNSSETAVIEFTVSESAPAGGFYLIHTDPDSGQSVYFSSMLTVGPTIPAFSSIQLMCLVGLIVGIAFFRIQK